jgi:hypothetical protein
MKMLVCVFNSLFLTTLCNVVAYADGEVQLFAKITTAGTVISTGIALIVTSLKHFVGF